MSDIIDTPDPDTRHRREEAEALAELTDFLNVLHPLIREPSVTGCEDAFFRTLRRELEDIGIHVQHYQGVLVASGEAPDSLILSAHIDRHGLLCTGPNEFQYAAFVSGNQGELTGDSVSEQMIFNIQGRFSGQRVQANLPYTGTYLGQATITNTYICQQRQNLIFELNGLDYLSPGTPISFVDRLKISDGFLSAQLDNVLSVAMLIHLFRCGFQGTALFTAEEEAGRSWRYALDWFKRHELTTQRLLVLDTSPFPTREAACAQELVLRRKDANGYFAFGITGEMEDRCQALGISYIHKDLYVETLNQERVKPLSLGRTELGRLAAATGGAINGTTLQIPTTGYHTAQETASLSSVRSALRLLKTYLNE